MTQNKDKNKPHSINYILLSGVFLLFDQLLKKLAIVNSDFSFYLIKPWLGWEFFANKGIAFGINLPSEIILFLTPFIITLFAFHLLRKKDRTNLFVFSLLFAGAISNFIDRVLFGFTIDYIRIYTGIINLADALIITSVILIIIKYLRSNQKEHVF